MHQLTVVVSGTTHRIPFSHGTSVREILEGAGLRIRSGCRGNGACGLCLVRIEAGSVNDPTKNERLILPPEQIEQNVRLACQLIPGNDLCIRMFDTVPKSGWRDLSPTDSPCAPRDLRHSASVQATDTAYGLAVDLGTTHISLSLWGLTSGNRLAGRIGLNPQSAYGADVVTRLIAASESAENARRIALMPIEAIHEALVDMSGRDGFHLREVTRVTIVGNTPMLVLLTEGDSGLLLQPRSWTRPIDCTLDHPQPWVNLLGIHPQSTVEMVPPFAGFVGSDLLAGVLSTHLTDRPGGLLVDFGTNSEIALWDGSTLWVTSAAGGPAFEGCGLQCGMPAEPGAIDRVDRQQDSDELSFHVIGGGEPKGVCGSGLVDLIALLCGTGKLKRTGKFSMPSSHDGFVLQHESLTLRLSAGDVDLFQRAKAAIGVGIKTLLASAKRGVRDLSRICVCGAFGRHLNIRNAQLVGLLPDTPAERIELCGNTALAGCEGLLLSSARTKDLASLRKRAAIINLSETPDFDTLFLENLYLQPLKVGES